MGWRLQRVVENALLDVGGNAVGVRAARTTLLLDQARYAADLEGAADFVEGVAVVTHDLARAGNVAELFGELEKGELSSCTVRCGGHSVLRVWVFRNNQNIPLDRVAALTFSRRPVGSLLNYFSRTAQRIVAAVTAGRRVSQGEREEKGAGAEGRRVRIRNGRDASKLRRRQSASPAKWERPPGAAGGGEGKQLRRRQRERPDRKPEGFAGRNGGAPARPGFAISP
jgi:hypothetical protein